MSNERDPPEYEFISITNAEEFIESDFHSDSRLERGVWVVFDTEAESDVWAIKYFGNDQDAAIDYASSRYSNAHGSEDYFYERVYVLVDGRYIDYYIDYDNSTRMKNLRDGNEVDIFEMELEELQAGTLSCNDFMTHLNRGLYIVWDQNCIDDAEDEDWKIQYFGVDTIRNRQNTFDALTEMYHNYPSGEIDSFFDYTFLFLDGSQESLALTVGLDRS